MFSKIVGGKKTGRATTDDDDIVTFFRLFWLLFGQEQYLFDGMDAVKANDKNYPIKQAGVKANIQS